MNYLSFANGSRIYLYAPNPVTQATGPITPLKKKTKKEKAQQRHQELIAILQGPRKARWQ